MLKLRYYQTDALKALHNYLSKENHGNPLIVMPTGSGKSLIIAKIISDFKQKHVLCLAHRTELIDQNYRELSALEPNLDISVYAAGLDRKELEHKAIISSVQSFYFIPEIDLPWIDKLIVDECHLIPKAENTQYLKVIRRLQKINPHLIIVGLSATPYRFDSGILIEGENKIFNDICYEISVSELVEKGFLAPLIVKARDRLDLSKIKKIAGDYSQKELEEKLGVEALVDKTVQDIIKNAGDKYNSWLIFAVGMKHLNLISASLEKYGISHRVIHAQLSNSQRAENIALFKEKKIRAIVNIDVLTTGFNAPNIDLIASLRPTQSCGLYVQMMGRGSRNAKGKTDCLILDYANNILNHGPIDAIKIIKTPKGSFLQKDKLWQKDCRNCGSIMRVTQVECKNCGTTHIVQDRKIDHNFNASEESILSGNPTWLDVQHIDYRLMQKKGHEYLQLVYYHPDCSSTIIDFYPRFQDGLNFQESEKDRQEFMQWYSEVWDISTGYKFHLPSWKSIKYVQEIMDTLDKPYVSHGGRKIAWLTREPKSILVMKKAISHYNRIILAQDFDNFHGEEKILRNIPRGENFIKIKKYTPPRGLISDEEAEKIIKKYNEGYTLSDSVKELFPDNINYEEIFNNAKSIVYKRGKNERRSRKYLSVFPISQEEWIKINFFRKFKECYYIPPKGKGCWLAYSSKVRKRVPFKVYKSYQPRIINIEIISYVLKFGPINNDESVTSECGNKTCINPDHLKIINKKAKGTEHGLEEKTKKEIIDLYNEGYRVSHAIKKVLNLKGGDKKYISCYDCIHNIVNGKSGKHFALISKKEWRKKNMQIDSSTS